MTTDTAKRAAILSAANPYAFNGAAFETFAAAVTGTVPTTCICREFHLNKAIFGIPECCHTTGQKPASEAVAFDARQNVAEARAWVKAQKATAAGGAARQGPAETVPAVDAPGTGAQ